MLEVPSKRNITREKIKITNGLSVTINLNKMNQYKLTLTFNNFNSLVNFYRNEKKKSERDTMSIIASIGCKGQIVTNPDLSINLTLYFRSKAKYLRYNDSYIKYTHELHTGKISCCRALS